MNQKEPPDDTPCEKVPEGEDAGVRPDETLSGTRIKNIIEALLFTSDEPLTLDRIQNVLEGHARRELHEAIHGLVEDYAAKEGALEIVEVASGYQVRTRPEFSQWIRKLKQQKPTRLTRSSLETLAMIAYRQPITRAEIESIRGVDSMGVLGSLLEKQLIRIIGRKDVPGRPLLYGTTPEFLEVFGLKNLKSLPTLKEIEQIIRAKAGEEGEAAAGNQGLETCEEEDSPPRDTEEPEDSSETPEGEGAGPEDNGVEDVYEFDGDGTLTVEIDRVLKAARSTSRKVKKELGLKESALDPGDEEAGGDTDEKGE